MSQIAKSSPLHKDNRRDKHRSMGCRQRNGASRIPQECCFSRNSTCSVLSPRNSGSIPASPRAGSWSMAEGSD